MSDDARRRRELADFLKTRRGLMRPEQFGLSSMGKRRTPGLRRDEVAQIAGVGVSWYTWLEQGRAITVSDQVVERLADVFQLQRNERRHLFVLARGMVPVVNEAIDRVILPPGLQAMLDALNPNPAYIVDHHLSVIAWNKNASCLFGDFATMSDRERNRVWFIFANAFSRQLFVDWELAAEHAVTNFRTAYDQYHSDSWFEEFVQDMQRESSEFCALWSQHNIESACDFSQEKDFNHPLLGRLSFHSTVLLVPVVPEYHMITLTPRSRETTAILEAGLLPA